MNDYFYKNLLWSVNQTEYTSMIMKKRKFETDKDCYCAKSFLHKFFLQCYFYVKSSCINKMEYYCNVCDITFKFQTKRNQLQSKIHKEK